MADIELPITEGVTIRGNVKLKSTGLTDSEGGLSSTVNGLVVNIGNGLHAAAPGATTAAALADLTSALAGKADTGDSYTKNETDDAIYNAVADTVESLTEEIDSKAPLTALDGKADLVAGKVPSAQIPGSYDDVTEFVNFAAFPGTGESNKIYLAIDTNKSYRWGGSSYVRLDDSVVLGETSSTAYRGDRGKTAFDHSQITGNPHGLTKGDLSLNLVDNTSDANKPISTAQQTALNLKADATTVAAHTANTSNPHNVTATQLGLGYVTNTSDADKPISTAQQAALDLKQNYDATLALLAGKGISGTGNVILQSALDAVIAGLKPKASVRCGGGTFSYTLASTVHNGSFFNGTTLATGDRVLIRSQTTSSENGVYVVNASGAPTRATDFNTWAQIPSALVAVEIGGDADKIFYCSSDQGGTVGTTAITFSDFNATGNCRQTANLSDLANKPVALGNLGGTTIGKNIFTATDEAAVKSLLHMGDFAGYSDGPFSRVVTDSQIADWNSKAYPLSNRDDLLLIGQTGSLPTWNGNVWPQAYTPWNAKVTLTKITPVAALPATSITDYSGDSANALIDGDVITIRHNSSDLQGYEYDNDGSYSHVPFTSSNTLADFLDFIVNDLNTNYSGTLVATNSGNVLTLVSVATGASEQIEVVGTMPPFSNPPSFGMDATTTGTRQATLREWSDGTFNTVTGIFVSVPDGADWAQVVKLSWFDGSSGYVDLFDLGTPDAASGMRHLGNAITWAESGGDFESRWVNPFTNGRLVVRQVSDEYIGGDVRIVVQGMAVPA